MCCDQESFESITTLRYLEWVTSQMTWLCRKYCVSALKPGRVIRVTFSPGHLGLIRFTIYPGLTRIGSREKQNCSFDDVETYKRYRVALS